MKVLWPQFAEGFFPRSEVSDRGVLPKERSLQQEIYFFISGEIYFIIKAHPSHNALQIIQPGRGLIQWRLAVRKSGV
jgi:hypothetical protein